MTIKKKQLHIPALKAKNVSFTTDSEVRILSGISIHFGNEKTGLVGRNGIGKTTLLRILLGELQPTSGKVERDALVAYLPQDFHFIMQQTVAEALGVAEKLAALHNLKKKEKDDAPLIIIGTDWGVEERVRKVFKQLHFSLADLSRNVGSLSGGERTKVIFAKLLLTDANFLILDEPTNNLDSISREAVYDFIRSFRGGLLIVSHDRALLNIMERIVELTEKGLILYGGNYETYVTQKNFERAAAKRKLVSAEETFKKIEQQAETVQKRQERRNEYGKKRIPNLGLARIEVGKMKDTSQKTTSHLRQVHRERVSKALGNLEEAQARILPENQIVVNLKPTEVPNGKLVFKFEKVSFGYSGGDTEVLKNLSFNFYGPIRLSVQGANGSGKTTLVKLMLGELQPISGEVTLGVEHCAYLDQSVFLLDREATLLSNIKRFSDVDETIVRKWLGLFLFRQDEVMKKVKDLSGGEKMRAALACVLSGKTPPQLLVLDEPTNNLDLNSIEQIESILLNYKGALVVISHDTEFLKNVGVGEAISL
ncbi:MAG: hypothetical protein A3F24_02490 [Candidatus Colwellbacteria bacterium RIFCSPHIGHO2_12_FULL_44_17]|uniref:ABC transporter domain-containing protein n=1 Tax=Candidatus Colwellbacteria bacterium RIFCSPHIGHO2_12_FULL_44_17 TaxID=1797689 RepID=A0A1G1Z597_9BACT|nr:MAG: hypothetical protein A3F24_02490 [Candidatus Colwellbacteria bacterium RIFCSPHIGHO2_12_FULL_44_17]